MADTALSALIGAVKILYSVYKNHKDSKRELEEVGNFLLDLGKESSILNSKIDGLNDVKNTLRRKLKNASKEVEEWSSRNSHFFHSDQRLGKIQGVRQKVKEAMHEADTQLALYNTELLHEVLLRRPHKPAKNAAVPDKHSRPAKPDVQHPKPHPSKPGAQGIAKTSPPRSKSTPGRAVPPSKAPPSSRPRTPIAGTSRRDKMVELFVPMDSDKQSRDVVGKLEALPGVKRAIPDQISKKVSVVPHKGVTLNTNQLIQEARLEIKVVAPTLWSNRPR